MPKVVIMQYAGPDDYASAATALNYAQQFAAAGGTLLQVFFYGPGVIFASKNLQFPSGANNYQAEWQQLAAKQQIPLLVCGTVASQYGIATEQPAEPLAASFAVGGLAEFMEALSEADTLLQFGNTEAQPPLVAANANQSKSKANQIVFEFQHSPWHASSRHGLDMLLMAVSLDIPCSAVFHQAAIAQLLLPEEQLVPAEQASSAVTQRQVAANSQHDPLKKIQMLPDLFDFAAFYCCADDVASHTTLAANTNFEQAFRVPVQMVTAEAIQQLRANAQHRILF